MKNEDEFEDFSENDYKNLLNQQNALEGFHLHLLEKKISERLLSKSIGLCEKNFFWNFYSINKKLSFVSKTYNYFMDLLKIEE